MGDNSFLVPPSSVVLVSLGLVVKQMSLCLSLLKELSYGANLLLLMSLYGHLHPRKLLCCSKELGEAGVSKGSEAEGNTNLLYL